MNIHADPVRENDNQPAADKDVQQQAGGVPPQFVDIRPTSVAQRRLQQMASTGPQASEARRIQLMANDAHGRSGHAVQRRENRTGLPDALKSGIEKLSGYSMDGVKVHYNSNKPHQLQAHAYAQGTDIHLAAGKEKHLPHEAWHVVQQAQGRVRPTTQMKGDVPVNDDLGLEREADVMGARALASGHDVVAQRMGQEGTLDDGRAVDTNGSGSAGGGVVQRDAASDINEAKADISKTTGYSERVLNGVNEYSGKIAYAHGQKHTHSKIDGAITDAAGGLKAWASNYYNKVQAYLYEAQKANDHTNVESSATTWHLARLGQDTDKEPDMQTLSISHASGAETSSRRAIELKTCTTAAQANVAKLVQEGLAQLQKREATGLFSSLLLTVHNDHPSNIYPYTEADQVDLQDTDKIQTKLIERINATAKGAGIKLPLEVRLEHNGKRYATVHYN